MIITEHVSDVITKDVVKSWKDGSNIFITAGCGKGKSFFAQNTLYEVAKEENERILYIIQRKRTLTQFQKDINGKENTIHLYLYQWLEEKPSYIREDLLTGYKYIVLDESHYFISDANFNNFTDKSFNSIFETGAIKILMTATESKIKRYLKEIKKIPLKEYDFGSNKTIGCLQFYQDDDSLFEKLDEEIICTPYVKAAVFSGQTKRAYKIFKKYSEDALFDCGTSNSYSQKRSEEEIEKLIEYSRFDKKILVATSVLDTGFSIKDREFNTIFIDDVVNIDSIIQFVGRKRMVDDSIYDTVSLFVRIPKRQKLGGILTNLYAKIEHAEYLRDHDEEHYNLLYERDADKANIVYHDPETHSHKINELAYWATKWQIEDVKQMLNKNDDDDLAFCRMVWDALAPQFAKQADKVFSPTSIIPTLYDKELKENLKDFCDNKKIFSGQKDKALFYKILNQKINGRLVKSPKTLNHIFYYRYGLAYRIEQFTLALHTTDENGDDKIKPCQALRVIDASNQKDDDIEQYLADCYRQNKRWYGKNEIKNEGEIIDRLSFTDESGRIKKTPTTINQELEKRGSSYRIKSFKTNQRINDSDGKGYSHSVTAWKIIKCPAPK